jgi:hypothetical protein
MTDSENIITKVGKPSKYATDEQKATAYLVSHKNLQSRLKEKRSAEKVVRMEMKRRLNLEKSEAKIAYKLNLKLLTDFLKKKENVKLLSDMRFGDNLLNQIKKTFDESNI